jgi:steroid 5-alpha reductase family enzyme
MARSRIGLAYKVLYATIVGPIFLTVLLMPVSGLPLSEQPGAKRRYENGSNWDTHVRYVGRTSILIPFPPQTYARLPTWIKRTVLLEFPMYVFDPVNTQIKRL